MSYHCGAFSDSGLKIRERFFKNMVAIGNNIFRDVPFVDGPIVAQVLQQHLHLVSALDRIWETPIKQDPRFDWFANGGFLEGLKSTEHLKIAGSRDSTAAHGRLIGKEGLPAIVLVLRGAVSQCRRAYLGRQV